MNLRQMIGLGIAGNIAGHLEQAGEKSDFDQLQIAAGEPKGLFPFYLPGFVGNPLSLYPVSAVELQMAEDGRDLQIEPEVLLICDIGYDEQGHVVSLSPKFFGAFNDCSMRRHGASKISQKKNWGPNSKGIASHFIPIDTFDEGGILDRYRLASFLRRHGVVYPYGIDTPVKEYMYFHKKLLDWIIDRLNHQKDEGVLEDMPALLQGCHYPKQAMISIGATRYTLYGESTYLQQDDEVFVALYPGDHYTPDQIVGEVGKGEKWGISCVHQRVL